MEGVQKDPIQNQVIDSTSDCSSRKRKSSSKVNPSFKSKRYRDKLRAEIKLLEDLVPVERISKRKVDSQTVFRLTLSYLSTKKILSSLNPPDSDPSAHAPLDTDGLTKALDGFLLLLSSEATILFVSLSIAQHLGFQQVDLLHRCLYSIVHPDDHVQLQLSLSDVTDGQKTCCPKERCRRLSVLVRMKCFNGNTTGYQRMHLAGHLRQLSQVLPSSPRVLFALCRPFVTCPAELRPAAGSGHAANFWSKHSLDLAFTAVDGRMADFVSVDGLVGRSFYDLVHPEDLSAVSFSHRRLIQTEQVQTLYFRLANANGQVRWIHTRGKVISKNFRKSSIMFSHCPIREEDCLYVQHEAVVRQNFLPPTRTVPAEHFGFAVRKFNPPEYFYTLPASRLHQRTQHPPDGPSRTNVTNHLTGSGVDYSNMYTEVRSVVEIGPCRGSICPATSHCPALSLPEYGSAAEMATPQIAGNDFQPETPKEPSETTYFSASRPRHTVLTVDTSMLIDPKQNRAHLSPSDLVDSPCCYNPFGSESVIQDKATSEVGKSFQYCQYEDTDWTRRTKTPQHDDQPYVRKIGSLSSSSRNVPERNDSIRRTDCRFELPGDVTDGLKTKLDEQYNAHLPAIGSFLDFLSHF